MKNEHSSGKHWKRVAWTVNGDVPGNEEISENKRSEHIMMFAYVANSYRECSERTVFISKDTSIDWCCDVFTLSTSSTAEWHAPCDDIFIRDEKYYNGKCVGETELTICSVDSDDDAGTFIYLFIEPNAFPAESYWISISLAVGYL